MLTNKTIRKILQLYVEDIDNPIITIDKEIEYLEGESRKIKRKLSTLKMTRKHRVKMSNDLKEYLKNDKI